MKKNKRGLGMIGWILLILVLVALGIGAYLLLSGNGSSIIPGTSSIPSPPALPN
jgi:hypothetical protein